MRSDNRVPASSYLLASSIAIATQAVNQPWGYSSFQDGENTGSLKGEGYFIFFKNLLKKRKKNDTIMMRHTTDTRSAFINKYEEI